MAKTPFRLDFDPKIEVAEVVMPELRRVTAGNASPMTFRGTNTYLLGRGNIAVIDPGPADLAHLRAIMTATEGQRISHIFVTHAHVDHAPLSRQLAKVSGAPVLALGGAAAGRSEWMQALSARVDLGGGEGVDKDFKPDRLLHHGEVIKGAGWSLQALATPGHFCNHMCFAWLEQDLVFTGDHVMGWATTMVSPPDGDLRAFMASLELMAARKQDRLYMPGHGAPIEDPQAMLTYQISHRKMRETQILAALLPAPKTALGLAEMIYQDISPQLIPAATRNVFAHLLDLHERKLVRSIGDIATGVRFFRAKQPG